MSEQTNNLLNLFSKLLTNPKLLFAMRTSLANRKFSQGGGGRRQGARGLFTLLLTEDGLTNAEIAEKLDIRPSSVTNMVKQLERGGFVARQQDEQDKRISRIYLTDKAHDKQAEQHERLEAMSEDLFENLTEEEILTLSHLLEKVLGNTQDFSDDVPDFKAFWQGRNFGQGFGRGHHHNNPWSFGEKPRKTDTENDETGLEDF